MELDAMIRDNAVTLAAILILGGCAGPTDAHGNRPATATLPAAAATASKDPWAGRSGESEALADIAAGRPIKLYTREISGERDVTETPGLRNCNPERFDVSVNARSKFKPLGADYYESNHYTSEELARLRSATLFARSYNLTWFAKKHFEVLKICPGAIRE